MYYIEIINPFLKTALFKFLLFSSSLEIQ